MTISAFTLAPALCAGLVLGAMPAYAQDPAPAPQPVVTDSSPAAAVLQGRAVAERRGMSGRFAGGFASGLLLGLIGTGITYAIAGSDDTALPALEAARLSSANPNYSLAYQQGYSERLKSRRRSSALTGGLLGTLTFVVIYVSATSGSN
jgi:hypothetical protein